MYIYTYIMNNSEVIVMSLKKTNKKHSKSKQKWKFIQVSSSCVNTLIVLDSVQKAVLLKKWRATSGYIWRAVSG